MSKHPDLKTSLLVVAMLMVVAVVLYPAVSGGFIFDDYPLFVENPVVHISSWHWQPWESLWNWSHTNIQRPLAMFSLALNYATGASIRDFKLTNLLIHLTNTMLAYLLVRQLIVNAWPKDAAHKQIDLWAVGVATIWAIHPLQVSTVMYVVQRMELLGFSFTILALLAYLKGRRLHFVGRHGWPWLLLSALLAVSGYYAKETAILVPAYALLMELTLLHFKASNNKTTLYLKLFYSGGCIAAIVVIFAYFIPHYVTAAAYSPRNYDVWQRVITQLRVLPTYIAWSVLPLPGQLHFYYDDYVASLDLLHPITTLLGGIFLLGLVALAFVLRHRRPLFAFGIGWFFVAHVLTSGPLPLELVFEHRNYPALLGLALAGADVLKVINEHWRSRMAAVLAVVLILNFGSLTAIRAATWGNPLLLAQTLVAINPGSSRAAVDLARRYVAMSGNNPDVPLYSLGIQQLERASALPSSSILPEEGLLIQAATHRDLASEPWWDSLQRKLRTQPVGPETHLALYGLQQALIDNHLPIDGEQLAKAYQIAIARDPNRVSLRAQYADLASLALNNPSLAAEQWEQALALEGNSPNYAIQIIGYLIESRREAEASDVATHFEATHPIFRQNTQFERLRVIAEQKVNDSHAAAITAWGERQ
jgi:hypothetical protein